MNVYRLDGGQDIVFTRLSYNAGRDTFCFWHATFAGDDRVAGYGATLPQAAADLYQQRRERRATRPTAGGARALAGAMWRDETNDPPDHHSPGFVYQGT